MTKTKAAKFLAGVIIGLLVLAMAWISYSVYQHQHQVTIEPSGIEVAP